MQRLTSRRSPNTRTINLVLMVGLSALLPFSACRQEDDAWLRVQQSHVLRVGMDASYPPFENLDDAGNMVGFDVDLAREIGRRLGLDVTFVNIAYDGLFDALLTGQVDALISALAASPQLEGRAAFSVPYFNAGDALVVKTGSPIQDMPDLEGHTLAVEFGSGGDVEARQWERRLSHLTINRYPDPAAALEAVLSGEADAAIVDGIAARLGIAQHPGLTLVRYVTETLFVIATPSKSPALHDKVDAALQEMLRDGTVKNLIERWFASPAD